MRWGKEEEGQKYRKTNKQTKKDTRSNYLYLLACLTVCPIPSLVSVIHFSPAGRQQPSDPILLSIKTNSALKRGSCRNYVGPCHEQTEKQSKHALCQSTSQPASLTLCHCTSPINGGTLRRIDATSTEINDLGVVALISPAIRTSVQIFITDDKYIKNALQGIDLCFRRPSTARAQRQTRSA